MRFIRQLSSGQWFDLNTVFLLMISGLFLFHTPLALCFHLGGEVGVKSLSMDLAGGDGITSVISSAVETCTDIALSLGHNVLPNLEAISFLRWLGQSVLAMISVIFLSFVTGSSFFRIFSSSFYPAPSTSVSPHLSEIRSTVLLL
ncbi:MAG: hypothetical protein ABEK50_09205 [bacterium]